MDSRPACRRIAKRSTSCWKPSSQAGYQPGKNIYLALDVAASELWNDAGKHYEFKKSKEKNRTADEMVALYEDWVRQYPIISIEDGLAEGDWDGMERR